MSSLAEVHSANDGEHNDAFHAEDIVDPNEISFSGATLELNVSNSENDVNGDESKSENDKNVSEMNKIDDSAVLEPIEDSVTEDTMEDIDVNTREEGGDDINDLCDISHHIRRNRPFSASMASRKSTRSQSSITSRTTLSSFITVNDYSCTKFFSHHDGTFDKKCMEAMDDIIKEDLDGKVLGSWLLTEIDHWDKEHERIFITTERSLLVIGYDFINNKVTTLNRVNLRRIDCVQIGDLVYATGSLNTPRQHGAVRLSWESTMGTASFGQRWNPFCTSIPYIVAVHHPMIYNEKESESLLYNVDDFIETTVVAIKETYKKSAKFSVMQQEGTKLEGADELQELEAPIEIQSYAGLFSTFYNQSMIGFNRDRNGLNF